MISAEIGNTWAEEEKSGDHRLEVPQKEYLTVRVEDNVGGQNGRIITSKKIEIGRLKVLSLRVVFPNCACGWPIGWHSIGQTVSKSEQRRVINMILYLGSHAELAERVKWVVDG
jgi:hypothetical protein